ncbi:MAG: type II toxin-antitoxin system HicB family antitoxin [Planctomycetota bacterium]
MDYVAIVEKADDGSFSVYIPDLPGCVSCGDTVDEAQSLIREAVALHLETLKEMGEPIPMPTSKAITVHAA